MGEEIFRETAPLFMKLLLPAAVLVTFVLGFVQGGITAESTGFLIVVGVSAVLAILYYWRMNNYYAALYTDKIVVQNFIRKNTFPFEGLTGLGEVSTTTTGGNPVWIRYFTLNYGSKSRKVRLAGLHYKRGKRFLDSFVAYLQQVAQAVQEQKEQQV